MRRFSMLMVLALGLGMIAAECDEAEEDEDGAGDADSDSDGDSDSDSDSDADADGMCAEDVAGTACGADCIYPPADIDCATACDHVMAVCDEPDCEDDCGAYQGNKQLCVLGCEGTKTLSCTNLTFGCYAEHTTCLDIGDCVNADF